MVKANFNFPIIESILAIINKIKRMAMGYFSGLTADVIKVGG